MTPFPATPAHAGTLAAVHAAAFPPAECWPADDLAVQLVLPGVHGLLLPFAPGSDREAVHGRDEGVLPAERDAERSDGSPPCVGRDCAASPLHPGREPLCGLTPEGEREAAAFILIRVAADEAEVLTLAVVPSAQGRGLGRRLLQAALDGAAALGAATMFLEVSPDNGRALALYAHAGFVRIGRRPHYYRDGGDALVLRCTLKPGAAAAGASRPAGA